MFITVIIFISTSSRVNLLIFIHYLKSQFVACYKMVQVFAVLLLISESSIPNQLSVAINFVQHSGGSELDIMIN